MAKILRLTKPYLITLLTIFCCYTAEGFADVSYKVQGYGNNYVVVVLSGNLSNNITTYMASDGMSLRISGLGVQFASPPSNSLPSYVTSIRQVKRGQYTDLLFNLRYPSELSTSPGISDLKFFLKRKYSALPVEPVPGPSTSASPTVTRRSPIKILTDTTAEGNISDLTLVFPDTSGLKSKSTLTMQIRSIAYALDVLWAWLTGTEFEIMGADDVTGQQITRAQPNDLEKLIKELTEEVVELRKEILAKDEAIRKLRDRHAR